METSRTSFEEHTSSSDYQERLAQDIALTGRVKVGYTSAEPSVSNPRPRIIDGALNEDAQDALGELFIRYERLCAREARRCSYSAHNRSSLGVEDLVNQGYFGLYHAAITFDTSRGANFTTHATHRIRSHLAYYKKQHESLVRLPSGGQRRCKKIWENSMVSLSKS